MDPLLAQLRQLRMTAMATALEQQRLTPHAYAELSFEERLGLLTEQEHISRDNNRIQRLRKQANFRIKAEPEGLRYPAARGLRKEQIQPLLQGQHLTYHQNILITGPTGSGKTYLACALGEQACRQNCCVQYYRLGRLLEALKLGHVDGTYLKLLQRLQKTDMLILDDWGLEGFKGKQVSDLLDVIEDRYERRSTIIVSQLPIAQWHELMDNPTVADALLDRLIHNAHRIELEGESQRKKNLVQDINLA
jgi:DNA replication protein DnaC